MPATATTGTVTTAATARVAAPATASARARAGSAAWGAIPTTATRTAILGGARPTVLGRARTAILRRARSAVLRGARSAVLRRIICTAARTAVRRRIGLRCAALPHHRRIHLNASARIGRRELRPGRAAGARRTKALASCFRLAQVHDCLHHRCSELSHFVHPANRNGAIRPLELPPPAGALPPAVPREGDPLGEGSHAALRRSVRSGGRAAELTLSTTACATSLGRCTSPPAIDAACRTTRPERSARIRRAARSNPAAGHRTLTGEESLIGTRARHVGHGAIRELHAAAAGRDAEPALHHTRAAQVALARTHEIVETAGGEIPRVDRRHAVRHPRIPVAVI